MILILSLLVVCCLAVVAYWGFVQFQKRKSLPLSTRNASIQSKRIQNPTRNTAHLMSSGGNTSTIGYDEDHTNMSSNLSPNLSSFIRNRNGSRLSEINYISPNSGYGYLPKTNILSDRNKHKEIKKEFTVKLSPFPVQTRNIMSPNLSIGSPKESIPMSHSQTINSPTQPNGLPENKISSRISSKRPMSSSDQSADLYYKKPRNFFETIDLDDGDMFELETPQEPIFNKKATKRSTISLDSELPLNSPLKRVKNNEILSSYSSSASRPQHLLNKRKYSPEQEASANAKVKKRTYIEELELLASDMSPYYRNVYNTKPDFIRKNSTGSNSHLSENVKLNANAKPPISEGNSSKQNSELIQQSPYPKVTETKINNFTEQLDEDEDSQDIILDEDDSVEEEEEEPVQTQENLYPISTHVFSIKDHEYDKKKSKNRLNQFLAAVQQASENEKKNSIPSEVDSGKQQTISNASSFENKPTLVGLLNEGSTSNRAPLPLTTTIVPADNNDSNENDSTNQPKPILSFSIPAATLPAPIATQSNTLTPMNANSPKLVTTSVNSNSFGLPISSISSSFDKPTNKSEPSINFNFSSMNSNSLFPASSTIPTFQSPPSFGSNTSAPGIVPTFQTPSSFNSNISASGTAPTFQSPPLFGSNTSAPGIIPTFQTPSSFNSNISAPGIVPTFQSPPLFGSNTSASGTAPTLSINQADNPSIKPANQISFVGLNPSPSNNLVEPKLPTFNSGTNQPMGNPIQFSALPSQTQSQTIPSLSQPTKTFSFLSQSANKPISASTHMFTFGQQQQTPRQQTSKSQISQFPISSKPNFDFSRVSSNSLNSSSSLPIFPQSSSTNSMSLNGSTNFSTNMNSNSINAVKTGTQNNLPSTTTSGFNFSAQASSLQPNTFAFNFATPSAPQNVATKNENMFNFAAPSAPQNVTTRNNNMFNFSASAAPQNVATKNDNMFSFAASPVQFNSKPATNSALGTAIASAPSAFPSLNATPTFTFGASQPQSTLFQFGK